MPQFNVVSPGCNKCKSANRCESDVLASPQTTIVKVHINMTTVGRA